MTVFDFMFTNFALIELCKRQDLANAHCFWRFLDFTYHSVALMDLSMQRLVVSKDGLKLCIVDFSEVGQTQRFRHHWRFCSNNIFCLLICQSFFTPFWEYSYSYSAPTAFEQWWSFILPVPLFTRLYSKEPYSCMKKLSLRPCRFHSLPNKKG